MDLRFPIWKPTNWKPAPGNDGLSHLRIQESNGSLVDRMQSGEYH